MNYDNALECGPSTTAAGYMEAKAIGMPSLKIRLERAVSEAEQRLVEAKRAAEIFARNPDLEEILNIMQRGRF